MNMENRVLEFKTAEIICSWNNASCEETLYRSPSGICFLEVIKEPRYNSAGKISLDVLSFEDSMKWLDKRKMPLFKEILKNLIELINKEKSNDN